MKRYITCLALLAFISITTGAQGLSKIADDTFAYVKAGTFGKPKVAKNTAKLSIGQVRVHYKFITSRASVQKRNAADVTVYLDSDITDQDLQQLTNEFYEMLKQKIGALGIGVTDWKDIAATEYYLERQRKNQDKKQKGYDGEAGQAWYSLTAFDGPVLLRWTPYGSTELIGFGQIKDMSRTSKETGGDLTTFDVVVDFASIMLNTEIKQDKGFIFYGDPYFHSDYSIGGMISIPQSYVYLNDTKNNFDQYKLDLPVAQRIAFAGKPYEDASKAALKTQNFFGAERHSFTPLVIPAKKERYMFAARKVLELYADLFAEKLRVLHSGEKPSDANTARNVPKDSGKTLEQVNAEAKKNNDTTAVTTGEMTAAAEEAVKKGDYKLAVQYYTEIIKVRPDDAEPYLKRSAIYVNYLKDFRATIKDCDQGVKLAPNEPAFYYNRGTAYVNLQDWKKAKKDFDKHISLNPNYAESYLNRGIANIYLKDLDAAMADFNKGIQVNPRLPNLYRARAIVYKAKGNAAAAQADEITAARLGN
ncbi:MAG: tetratricopeptide repeat protein [Pyrinomonadaceae bacterium]